MRISSLCWFVLSLTSAAAIAGCSDDSGSEDGTGGTASSKGGNKGVAGAAGVMTQGGAPGAAGVPNQPEGGTPSSGGTTGSDAGAGGFGGDFLEGGVDNAGGSTGHGGVGVQPGGGAAGKGGNGTSGGTAGKAGTGGSSNNGGSAGKGGSAGSGGTLGNAGATAGGVSNGGVSNGGASGGISGSAGTFGGGSAGTAGASGGGGTAGSPLGGGAGGGAGGSGGIAGSAGAGGQNALGWQKIVDSPIAPSATAIDPRDDSLWLAARFKGSLKLSDSVTLTASSAGSWVLARYNSSTGALMQSFQTMNDASTIEGASTATPTSLAVDETGNLFIGATGLVGDAALPASGGSHTLTYSNDANGDNDAVVVKLDASGNYLWGFNFAVAAADDTVPVYIGLGGQTLALTFRLSVASLDKTKLGVGTTGTGTFSQAAASSEASFVLASAFNASTGAYKWASRFGASNTDQRPACLAVDSSGDVVLAGQFDTGLNFAPSDASKALAAALPGEGSPDIFTAKLAASNGAHVWSFGAHSDDVAGGLNGTDVVQGCSLARGADDLILFGNFDGPTLDFQGKTVTNPDGWGSLVTFVAKVSGAGVASTATRLPRLLSASLNTNGDYLVASGLGTSSYDFGDGHALSGLALATFSSSASVRSAESVAASGVNATRTATWFGATGQFAAATIYDPLKVTTLTSLFRHAP